MISSYVYLIVKKEQAGSYLQLSRAGHRFGNKLRSLAAVEQVDIVGFGPTAGFLAHIRPEWKSELLVQLKLKH